MEYQKELSNKEKSTYILECIKNINKVNSCQQIIVLLESLSKTLVTAKYSKLWIANGEQLCSYQNDYIVYISQNKGLISKAFKNKEIFYINDATREVLYKEEIDNINKLKIKDIIYLPIKNQDGDIKFIIQIMTSIHNIQQFTKNDIDTLQIMYEYIHNIDLCNCCEDNIENKLTTTKEQKDIIGKVLSFFK